MACGRKTVQREPFETGRLVKNVLTFQPCDSRGGFDFFQHGADVNRLAVVAAVIFAETLQVGCFQCLIRRSQARARDQPLRASIMTKSPTTTRSRQSQST
jgi:hypothetical protein